MLETEWTCPFFSFIFNRKTVVKLFYEPQFTHFLSSSSFIRLCSLFSFVVDSPMVIDSSDDEDFECTSETTPEIRDIDTDSGIFYVSEYASEIFQYLKQAEVLLFKFIIGSNKVIRKYRMQGHFGPPVLHVSKSFEERSIT